MGKEQIDQILRIVSDSLAIRSTNIDLDLALLVFDLRKKRQKSVYVQLKQPSKLTSILPFLVNGACEKL